MLAAVSWCWKLTQAGQYDQPSAEIMGCEPVPVSWFKELTDGRAGLGSDRKLGRLRLIAKLLQTADELCSLLLVAVTVVPDCPEQGNELDWASWVPRSKINYQDPLWGSLAENVQKKGMMTIFSLR